MIGIIIIEVILVILLIEIILFGILLNLKRGIKKYYSNAEEFFIKRWELIPNLLGIANGYIKYEKSTLQQITMLVSRDYNSLSEDDKFTINVELSKRISSFLSFADSYPEMEDNANYVKLKVTLNIYENEISKNIQKYNELVNKYNQKIKKGPTRLIARIFNFQKKRLFQ